MDTLRTLSEIDCLNHIVSVHTACGDIWISNCEMMRGIPETLIGIDSWKYIIESLKKFLPWLETTEKLRNITMQESYITLITKIEDDNKSLTFWINEYNEFIKNPLTYNFRGNEVLEYHRIILSKCRHLGEVYSFGYGLNGFQHLVLLEKWCEFMEAFKVSMDKMSDDRIKNIISKAQYKFMKNEGRRSVQDRLINDILIQRGMHQRLMKCLIYLFEAEMKCKLYKDYKKDYNLITLEHLCEMYKCYLKGSDVDIRKILETLYKTVPFTRKGQFKNTTSCSGFFI